MSGGTVNLILTGPAKVNGRREPVGRAVTVSHTLALQLAASGVIDPAAAAGLALAVEETPLSSDFDAAVLKEVEIARAEIEERLEAGYAEKLAAAAAALAKLEPLYAAAQETINDLRARLSAAEARASDAEAALVELSAKGGDGGATDQPEGGETPPADGAANTGKAGRKPASSKT